MRLYIQTFLCFIKFPLPIYIGQRGSFYFATFDCAAELAYYQASGTSFATSTHNKFADNGLKAAIIMGQYTIGIIPKKNILKYFVNSRVCFFIVITVVMRSI